MNYSLTGLAYSLLLLFLTSTCADAQQPELVVQRGHSDSVRVVAFSPDGQTFASVGLDGALRLWDRKTGAELRAIAAHAGGASVLAFQPGGRQLVTGGADQTLKLWDVETGALKRTIEKFNPAAIAYSPDGKMLAAVELTQPK